LVCFDELAAVAESEPAEDGQQGLVWSSHYVIFLPGPASDSLRSEFAGLCSETDDFQCSGAEVHWRIQGKVTESPLFGAGLERATRGVLTTTRNMNTVRRLIAKTDAAKATYPANSAAAEEQVEVRLALVLRVAGSARILHVDLQQNQTVRTLPMTSSHPHLIALTIGAFWTACTSGLVGQECRVPDSVRVLVPAQTATDRGYETLPVTGPKDSASPLGIGHLHYSNQHPVVDRPTGEGDWLRRVELPLSRAPGASASTWVVGGWIIEAEAAPEPLGTQNLIETGYEEPSFIVLSDHPSGWLRIRFGPGSGDRGTGWTPRCALSGSPARLQFTTWDEWFLSETISPLFFRSGSPGTFYSEPSANAPHLPLISADYILEPLEVLGEWMRVTLKEPSDYCQIDVTPLRREGWVRWYATETGPLVWYFTRGCQSP